jgi:hypothetical protein
MPKVIVESDWYTQVALAATSASFQIQEAIRYAPPRCTCYAAFDDELSALRETVVAALAGTTTWHGSPL